MKFGGGLSNEQLAWMRHELAEAAGQGQRALVFCHLPIHPNSGPPASLMWNFQEAMSVIEESGCVAGVFSGHAHQVTFLPIPLSDLLLFCQPCCPDPHAMHVPHVELAGVFSQAASAENLAISLL